MTDVLIVDDEPEFAAVLKKLLTRSQFTVTVVHSLHEARRQLAQRLPDILLLDVMLPDGSGLDLIAEVGQTDHDTRIVVMTGHPTLEIAVDSLRAQVADFLTKPVDSQQLLDALQRIRRSLRKNAMPSLSAEPSTRPVFEQFVGTSKPMLDIYRLIERVAPSNASVLIRGASGTGKELVAQAIHARSERRNNPFLSLNCGAVSTELIGSELFGHEKGSFTGATRQHIGYFERADGGTLFLDEITEMPLDLQVQLLRVLETGRLSRIGGDHEVPIDVRIVAASNRDLAQAIQQGAFREDLYFRLAVFPIQMPALSQRRADIAPLAEHFLTQLNAEAGSKKRFTAGALDALGRYPWPGNVRELKNTVQRAFILADEQIGEHELQLDDTAGGDTQPRNDGDGGLYISVGDTPVDVAERALIFATLKHYGGNKTQTASALGISLKTLYNRLKEYGEEAPEINDNSKVNG